MRSGTTALLLCLEHEQFTRSVYQGIFNKYPTLTAFAAAAKDTQSMIAQLEELLAERGIPTPDNTSPAKTCAMIDAAATITDADALGIRLVHATADLMAQLMQTTTTRDALRAEETIRYSALAVRLPAFLAEQATLLRTPPPALHVVQFTPSQKGSTFLSLLRDESIDVIELAGTYHLPFTVINVDRVRPILVRPAAGATVVLSGQGIGADPQFWFGLNGRAGNITMQGFIFDGFVLGQQGVVQARDCHDITLNDMVVRNSHANTALAKPYHAWAVYLDATSTAAPVNFTANRWTVECSDRTMSGLQVRGGSHVTAMGWSVANAWYAIYAIPSYGSISDFILDGWNISNTGAPVWASANTSVYVENCSGRFSNIRATGSGALLNVGHPKMTDGGGNSLPVVPLEHWGGHLAFQF